MYQVPIKTVCLIVNNFEVRRGFDVKGFDVIDIDIVGGDVISSMTEMPFHHDMAYHDNMPDWCAMYSIDIDGDVSPTIFVDMVEQFKLYPVDRVEALREEYIYHDVKNYPGEYPVKFSSEKERRFFMFHGKRTHKLIHDDHMFYSPGYCTHDTDAYNLFTEYLTDEVKVVHHWKKDETVIWNNRTMPHKRLETNEGTRKFLRMQLKRFGH